MPEMQPEKQQTMKVCFLIRSLDVGGAQTQIVALARGLARRGHDVHVVSFYDAAMPFEDGVRYRSLGKKGRYQLAGPVGRLVKFLRRLRPDVVHTYLPTANVLGAFIKLLVPTSRLVWGIRAADMRLEHYDRLSRLSYRLQPCLAGAADLVVCNSVAARDHAAGEGIPENLLAVVYSGFDTDLFCADETAGRSLRAVWRVGHGEPLIGHVGRLDPMKDHTTFLRAASYALARRPECRFVCVGGGPDAERIRLGRLAAELGLGDRIIWAGERHDMPAVYNALDVFVSSSLTESLPNTVGEAMACTVPCVVSKAGDSAVLVGPTGATVQPGDPEALSGAILSVLDLEPDERHRLGIAARKRIEAQFGLDAMVANTESLLSTLTKR